MRVSCIQLCSGKDIEKNWIFSKKLILKAVNTSNCETCRSKFDFKNIRYFC